MLIKVRVNRSYHFSHYERFALQNPPRLTVEMCRIILLQQIIITEKELKTASLLLDVVQLADLFFGKLDSILSVGEARVKFPPREIIRAFEK